MRLTLAVRLTLAGSETDTASETLLRSNEMAVAVGNCHNDHLLFQFKQNLYKVKYI